MVEQLRAMLSFLTILPVGRDYDVEYLAKNMFLFPLAGVIIGLLLGSLGFGLSLAIPGLVVGLIVTAALFLLTGSHHTDGLADFADGLMAKGDTDLKRDVMRDPSIGSAGMMVLLLYLAGSVIAISLMSDFLLFRVLIASEVISKFVMVFLAYRGTAAWEGIGSPFTEHMKSTSKFLAAGTITISLAYVLGGLPGLLALGVAVVIGFILLKVSNRSFGGVSGDVFGASNEITRVSSLIILAVVLS
ncbi:MAG: adenosylcobinamide-GDP ribazoletransferase [Nitrososphaerales archaeon]